MQRHAILIALAAALVAGLALTVALIRPATSVAAGSPGLEAPTRGPSEEILALGRRIEELAADVDMARAELATLRGEGREPAVVGVDPEIERRIARLEQAIDEKRRGGAPPEGMVAIHDADGNFLKFDDDDRDKHSLRRDDLNLDELTARALDPGATEELKIRALQRLRGEKLADGSDARSPAVVAEMIVIGEGSADARLRADAWRQISGVRDPQLVAPLIASLANDPDPTVREEAAETLGDFLPDGNVKSALQYAMEHDVADRVRRQAAESLH